MEQKTHEIENKKCKFFVKKSQKNRLLNCRKRKRDSSSSSEGIDTDIDISSIITSKTTKNPMIQSTNSYDLVKHNRNNANNDPKHVKSEEINVSYSSDRSTKRSGPQDMGATSTVQTETDKQIDAQSIFERSLIINKQLKDKDDDHVYRGVNNYKQYIQKKDTPQGNASSGFVRKGPVRAPDNIRATVRWDYQPDICKDYKETGFCGFGDSCKFLHDRSDYKAGWQLEIDSINAHNSDQTPNDFYKIEDNQQLPFKCLICRSTFQTPVVTKCKHYFCEKCALNQFKKSSRCYVCGQQTFGVFNSAKDIVKLLSNEKHEQTDFDYNLKNEIENNECDENSDS